MAKAPDEHVIKRANAQFREYLHGRGLKYTPERKTLLLAILKNHDHFEAEQLLLQLRAEGARVAKATVYRTLPLLVDCGLIRKVQFDEKHAHYEHTWDQAPHDHMFCQSCHRIIEFDNPDIDRIKREVAGAHAFEVRSHRFQITGLCRECAAQNLRSEDT